MGSYGGHVLPGTFFLLFGFWYVIKYARRFLRKRGSNGVFYCCKGRIPFSGIVIEGIIKVFMVSIGILVELFYPGAPMGKLHGEDGEYTHPMNWQHATMYFFFGLSGVADIVSYTARHVVPAGFDRIFGAFALFVEGYLFFFHLHGRSNIDTRVHVLLVLAVWPCALFAFLQCLVMNKRKILHIFEMLTATLLIAQGLWFWQAAYILYPPNGSAWDPCMEVEKHEHTSHFQHNDSDAMQDCNSLSNAELNLMFITMFWSWHIAGSIAIVSAVYFLTYQYLKCKGTLDPSFSVHYEHMSGGNAKFNSTTPLNGRLLSDGEEEDEI
ncbi:transmembrane protein 45B-like isoform X2 [Clavelina lepadiformis]|uniref:Transmembrane protein 45B n=1 Tax=Clavelina lepadiformis TaxID=159417 RepID=A0ABP0FXT5_CLALP